MMASAQNNSVQNLTYVRNLLPKEVLICLSVVIGVICILGIILNLLILRVTKEKKAYTGPDERQRKNSLVYYFLWNLAFSDLLSLIIGIPLVVGQSRYFPIIAKPSDATCRLVRAAQHLPMVTIYIITTMCLERYFSLVRPFNPLSPKIFRRLIKLCWVTGFLVSIMFSTTFKSKQIILTNTTFTFDCILESKSDQKIMFFVVAGVSTATPCIFIIYSTLHCIIKLNSLQPLPGLQQSSNDHLANEEDVKRRSTLMLFMIVLTFLLSYLPYFVFKAMKSIFGYKLIYHNEVIVRYALSICAYSNSVFDPIMYAIIMKSLRGSLKTIFTRRRTTTHDAPTADGENRITCRQSDQSRPEMIEMNKVRVEAVANSESTGSLRAQGGQESQNEASEVETDNDENAQEHGTMNVKNS